jgi:hypothetical protein
LNQLKGSPERPAAFPEKPGQYPGCMQNLPGFCPRFKPQKPVWALVLSSGSGESGRALKPPDGKTPPPGLAPNRQAASQGGLRPDRCRRALKYNEETPHLVLLG